MFKAVYQTSMGWLKSSGWLLRAFEFVAVAIGVIIGVVTFVWETSDRKNSRLVASWQLLTEVSPGASGKRRALEYLHENREPLIAINLSADRNGAPVYLQGLDLFDDRSEIGAFLDLANFQGAILQGADLQHSRFRHACLQNTEFGGAKLVKSDFSMSDLTKANLLGADLTGTDLDGANLSGAHMNTTIGLTQAQLDRAFFCLGNPPNLPQGLSVPNARESCQDAEGCLWGSGK